MCFRTILICLLILAHLPAMAGIAYLNETDRGYDITSDLRYYIDHKKQLDEFKILYPRNMRLWNAIANDSINFGYHDADYWFLITLDATSSSSKQWHLLFSNALINKLDIYKVTENGPRSIYSSGSGRAFSRRKINHQKMIVPVDLYEQTKLLIRANSKLDMTFSLEAWSEQNFWPELQLKDNLNWLYFGLIFTMSLYNLFLFFSVSDRSYLFYVFFIGSYGLYMFILDGYFSQIFWPANKSLPIELAQLCISILLISGLMFNRSFLKLNAFSKKLDHLCLALVVLNFSGIGLIFLLESFQYSFIMLSLSATSALFTIYCSLYCALKGYKPAYFYCIGWLFLSIGNTILACSKLGWLPIDHYFATLTAKFASGSEALLLSFALAHRIKLLKSERSEQAMKAQTRSQFLAKMSHEIRTPLNGVLGMAELLKATQLNAQQKQYIKTIESSGSALLSLINDILDHSKIDAGKLEIEHIAFNLNEIIQQSRCVFDYDAERKNILIKIEYGANLPQNVLGDPNRIRQILINFIANALKFSNRGVIKIRVSQPEIDIPDQIKFEIIDQGIGIAHDQQSTLFREYQQANSNGEYGGTGLGLAICKQLVEVMQGEIGVISQQNMGSNFWFKLSLPAQAVNSSLPVAQIVKKFASLNILIAEDNPVNQLVIQGLLKRQGHHMTIAEDGHQVYQIYQKHAEQFDLILMDCEMPKMDGFSATRCIRDYEKEHQLATTPIMALSAHATVEHKQKALDCGMNQFLSKPIINSKLQLALAEIKKKPPNA